MKVGETDAGMADEDGDDSEHHEDVPLQWHAHRDRREDAEVEDEHDGRGHRGEPSAAGEEQHQRHQASTAVEMCAIQRERRPGRRSSGKCSKNVRLMVGDRQIGLFDIIVAITNGKCLLSLLVAAPTQMTRKTSLAPRIMSVPTNRNVTQNAPYTSPRAARKTVLSRRPRTARSAMIVAICQIGRTRRRSAGRRSSVTPSSRVHHDHHQECRIEGDVEGAAGVSGGEWDLGPGWLANGLEAQPVEDRSHRREESVVERAEAATQSDDLEQHRVEHDLLEDDRFVVPGGDIEDAVDTGGGHHNRPADDDVGEDLAT